MTDGERRPRCERRLALLGLSTLVLVLSVLAFLAANRERVVALGHPQRFDDFAFAVVNVHRRDAIEGLRPELGLFLIVRLGIRNQAKVVDYQFQPESAFVEDAKGRRFPLAVAATRKHLESPGSLPPCDAAIPAGSSCTTDLVFDVPADIKTPRFLLSSGAVGDMLDRILEGKVRFALDEEPR